MDAPRSSLNALLPWPETAALLGLSFDSAALPVRGDCPLCGKRRFQVYADSQYGGVWFHCPDCSRAGDLIELAAAMWSMDVPAAVSQLVRLGAALPTEAVDPERVADYIRDFPGWRQRQSSLWQRAREWLPRAVSPTLNRLRARLRLINYSHSETVEGWKSGLGKLLGAAPREEIEACFCPGSTGQGGAHAERYKLNPSRGRVFHGPGWGDVLVIAYHDLPDRISGFEFIGRKGDCADHVFRLHRSLKRVGSNQYMIQPVARPEAGLAGLGTIDEGMRNFGRTVFAVRDAVLALRLQMRNLNSSRRPLPLVCWHDSDQGLTRDAWQLFAGRPVIFWGLKLDAALLFQVIQIDGNLVVAGPEELSNDRVDHYLRLDTPFDRMRGLQRRARPWREALRQWAHGQADGAIAELWFELERYRLDLPRLAQECGGGRLQDLLPPTLRQRSARVGNRMIVERADGWYVQRGSREVPLIDAVLRIDVISTSADGVFYQGRILYRGTELEYEVAAAELERHPARWLRELVIRAGKGVVHFAPGIRGLVEIALKFHEPVIL